MNLKYKKMLRGCLSLAVSAAVLVPIENAHASTWTGSANYGNAGTVDGDENNVGPFNQYHFGSGVILTSALTNPTVGQTVSGWFQSSVDSHKLQSTGQTVSASNLNTTGSGSGYELTLVSNFSFTVTNVDAFTGNVSFGNATGTSSLYFDTTPDYSFALDSGFDNGNLLLTGTISGGNGLLSPLFGIGAGQYSLNLLGSFGSYNSAVYNPGIGGANALFSLNANSSPLIAAVSSVQGHSVAGGFAATTTGTLTLTAVPVPAAVWLFGSALVGLTSITRRKALIA
ncbi:MAG: flocculation-associated PEP-CTERM protein PepA [Methylococcaceae bacterium]|nr:flocculation-associated PEP-CTERM protein PepA [Methylococcaceae bacterium]MDP3904739.1 flocculation-associated PEP-CTERM protein PepA [Methylococcaceae bacterium]